MKKKGRGKSVRARVSAAEWKARVELAAAYRLVALFEMNDLIYNHISVRVPGEEGHFLLNPYGMLYEEMTASCLIKVDLSGKVLFNPNRDYDINPAGFVIHGAIHEARPEIDCVVHTHTPAGMAVSALKCGLLPLTQTAMRFAEVGYHDYEGVVLELDERKRLLANLGQRDVMILRNHGLLAVGSSVAEAFNNIYRIERSCRAQILAMSCGSELVIPSPEVVRKTNHVYKPEVRRRYGLLEWPAMLRMLDRRDPSYRT
ncbi:MAG: class II aldolase/adducin family protein [Alphaproteobacteria bacterium]|nr:class II aldolase/adducin family protein [Alphaproteobacteria bacterium]